MNDTELLNSIAGSLYSTKETQINSYEMGKYVVQNNIEGDIIECGVAMAGNFASMILGAVSMPEGKNRKFWAIIFWQQKFFFFLIRLYNEKKKDLVLRSVFVFFLLLQIIVYNYLQNTFIISFFLFFSNRTLNLTLNEKNLSSVIKLAP